MAQSCKACKWLDVPLNKAGKRVVYQHRVYACRWPEPQPLLCDAITTHIAFRLPLPRYRMAGSDGEHCPTWERRGEYGSVV